MRLHGPRLVTTALLASLALLPAAAVRAEAEPNSRVFLEVGQMAFPEDGGFATGGVRISSVAPLRPGLDWSLTMGLVPALLGTSELDLALPVPLGTGVSVIPRAGVTAFMVYGGDIGGAAFAWNYGVGLVLNPRGSVALRGDLGVRALGAEGFDENNVLRTASIGFSW